MARKVILDVDPGVDDAMALCLALAAPELEVLAVTATGGNVSPEQSTRNVQAVIEQLDPPRWPRIGAASREQILRTDARHLYGENGFCGVHFNVADLHHRHQSSKVICDEIRSAPGEVTIIATGPLSNIAEALKREPDLASMIGHLIMLGGTVSGPGNITPSAEFNVFCDAHSAQYVFRAPVTKTLLPIDVSSQVVFGYNHLEKIPAQSTRTGALLKQLLPGAFHAHRQRMGLEGIYIHDVVAVVAALQSELFTTEKLHGDVETEGQLTHGATVFDRRLTSQAAPNMDVVVEVDAEAVLEKIVSKLSQAA